MARYRLEFTADGAAQLDALVPFRMTGKNANGRPVLQAVGFGAEFAAATDSFALGLVPLRVFDRGEIAGAPAWWLGAAPSDDDARALMIDAAELRKALKAVKPGRYGPRFASATFDTEARTVELEGNGTTIRLTMTDGEFPNVGSLLPDEPRPIRYDRCGPLPTVDAELVGRFAKLADAVGGVRGRDGTARGVRLVPGEGTKPVVVYGADELTPLGLVMPMRDDARAPLAEAQAS